MTKKTARMIREELYQLRRKEAKDFSDMVHGKHPEVEAYREYVLAEIRLARRRVKLMMCEIDNIGLALSKKLIEPDIAVEWMRETNTLRFLSPTEPGGEDVDGRSATAAAEAGTGNV